MKNVILMAALAVAGCGALEALEEDRIEEALSFSYGGMSYDHASGNFSGADVTPVASMPVSGVSIYRGEYTAEVSQLGGSSLGTGAGSATLTADFGAASASLQLSGDLQGTISGDISGNSIERRFNPLQFFPTSGLEGRFYGNNAQKVAGTFFAPDQDNDQVSGSYIVTR